MSTAYPQAATRRYNWLRGPRGGTADSHLHRYRGALRADGQQAHRESMVARVCIEKLATLVVAEGLAVEPRSADENWNVAARRLWERWCAACDVAGEQTYAEMLRAGVRAWATDGEFGFLRVNDGRPRLQLLEAELLEPVAGVQSATRIGGKELKFPGGPVALYHLREWGDYGQASTGVRQVPAEHVDWCVSPKNRRINQRIGEPTTAAVCDSIQNQQRIDLNVGLAVELGASPGLIRKRGANSASLQEIRDASITAEESADVDTSNREIPIEPGMVLDIDADDDFTQINPTHPQGNLVDWQWAKLQQICEDIGVPVSIAFNHWIRNFHASRTEVRFFFDSTVWPMRGCLGAHAVSPHYLWVVREAILAGDLPLVDGWDAYRMHWPAMPLLDPKAEGEASALLIDRGLSTYEAEARKFGFMDVDDLVRQRAVEREMLEAAGVLPGPMQGQGERAPEQQSTRAPDGDE